MSEFQWPVVPICERQLRDVRPEDLVKGGHFRLCNTYRGGGGYDQFPAICERRVGIPGYSNQFVVQLYSCHLKCPYCYVTPDGIFGDPVMYTTAQLVDIFCETKANVFHLMGGAPALYLSHWPELLEELYQSEKRQAMFHSDLLLTEREYPPTVLRKLAKANALFAVDIKGLTDEEYFANTGRRINWPRIWSNLGKLERAGVRYYITFTNCAEEGIAKFWENFQFMFPRSYDMQRRDAFSINLIQYEALKP